MSVHKLVFASNRRPRAAPKKPKSSSRRHRAAYQVNWTVYIAEGLVANLQNSLDFQSYEMTGAQRQKLRVAIRRAIAVVDTVRENLD